jgi:hypothetical protein
MEPTNSRFNSNDLLASWRHLVAAGCDARIKNAVLDDSTSEPKVAICVGLGALCNPPQCEIIDQQAMVIMAYSDNISSIREPWYLLYEIEIESENVRFEDGKGVCRSTKRLVRNLFTLKPQRLDPEVWRTSDVSTWKRISLYKADFAPHRYSLNLLKEPVEHPLEVAYKITTIRNPSLDPKAWELALEHGYDEVILGTPMNPSEKNTNYARTTIK